MPPIRHPNIRHVLQTRLAQIPHPSNGYGEPYSEDMRQLVMRIRQSGQGNNPLITHLRAQHDYPCQATEDRWYQLLQRLGHYRACRRTGNSRATGVFRGQDLVLLSLYRIVYPKASTPEV